MRLFPEDLRRIAEMCKALDGLDSRLSSQKSQVVIDGKIELRHSESDHDEDVYGWLTDEDGIGWAFTPKS
jgi:hypothetical protein